MTAPAATLAEYTDAELAHWYGTSTDETWHSMLEAEMERRDQAEAAARQRHDARQARRDDPVRCEWQQAAYSQYLEAERVTNGNLVRRGSPVTDGWQLWSGPERWALANCTEELANFWRDNPRITVTAYQQHVRDQKEAYADDQLADHDARSVRHPTAARAAVTVPGARPDGDRRPGGPAGRPERRQERRPVNMITHAAERAVRDGIRTAVRSGARAELGRRAQAVRQDQAGTAVAVPERSAVAYRRPQQVDGALVLDLTRAYLGNYVALPGSAAQATVTAWVAHAVARDRDDTGIGPLIWRASPRLLATSRHRGSGKSTLLDLITILTRSRNGKMPKVTPRAIAEVLGSWYEVAALDEAKLIFGSGRASQELQGILLAGYTPRASYAIKGKTLPLFGAVAYAGKDELITDTSGALGDLLDRTITIRMRAPSRPLPEVDEQAEDEGDMLAAALIAWTDSVRDELRQAAKDIAAEDREAAEDGASLRSPQIWRPLRAIARVAGGTWPEEMDAASQQLTAGAAAAETGDLMAELQRRAQSWGAAVTTEDDDQGEILEDPTDEDDWS